MANEDAGKVEEARAEEPARRSSSIPVPVLGVVLILVGLALLARPLVPEATISRLWPLVLLVPVFVLGQRFLEKGKEVAGVLVPLGILSYLTVYFLWVNLRLASDVGSTWPHFLLAPAFGLFLLYLATRNTNHLVPAAVLAVLAGIFLGGMHRSTVVVAVILIAAGAFILAGPLLKKPRG